MLKTKAPKFMQDFKGNITITFEVDKSSNSSAKTMMDKIVDGKEYEVSIKPFKKKRSIDANSYMWILLNEIQKVIKRPAEEIYREYIKKRGKCAIVCVTEEALGDLIIAWQNKGIGWFAESYPSKIKGCQNVHLYYGTSIYDTEEMCDLVDEIVEDCKDLGIETDYHMKILLGKVDGVKIYYN